MLGSDEAGLVRALTGLRAQAQGTLVLAGGSGDAHGAFAVKLDASRLPAHGPADVLLAVVEDDLASKVERGENRGRTLQHAAVVRKLGRVGEIAGAAWLGEARLALDPAWRADSLRLVAFIQERQTGRVLAAGSIRAAGTRAAGSKE